MCVIFLCILLQVLGLFIVQLTAIGCLYFLDPTDIADSSGLEAVGILLLLMNGLYVLAMLILIAIYGAAKTKRFTCKAFVYIKTSSQKFKHSVSNTSRNGFAAFKAPSLNFREFRSESTRSSESSSDVVGEHANSIQAVPSAS